mgnify:CR=1 FL=1
MAVDKLVDSTQLDADLTSVANAIRTKGGTAASLAFPSDFVSAIEAISTGGGGGLKYELGTFTLQSDVAGTAAGYPVSHGLGEAPKVVIIWTEDYSTENPPAAELNFGYIYLVDIVDCQQRFSSSSFGDYPLLSFWYMNTTPQVGTQNTIAYSYSAQARPTDSVFYLYKRANSTYWRAGVTYHYFVSEAFWGNA